VITLQELIEIIQNLTIVKEQKEQDQQEILVIIQQIVQLKDIQQEQEILGTQEQVLKALLKDQYNKVVLLQNVNLLELQ